MFYIHYTINKIAKQEECYCPTPAPKHMFYNIEFNIYLQTSLNSLFRSEYLDKIFFLWRGTISIQHLHRMYK
jgi:hypothetical protein